jgi:uncharacterized protein
VAAALASLLLVAMEVGEIGESDAVSGAVVVFVSITVEALPFVLLGALVSAALAVLVPDRVFARVADLPRALQVPGAAIGGMAFPVCECGSVPVARRLALRGLDESASVAFMLAAPILNPVVLASTAVAFQGNDALAMTLGRAGIGLVVAIAGGLLLARFIRTRKDTALPPRGADAGHLHDHGLEGTARGGAGRLEAIVEIASADLLLMGRFVVAGAALAATAQAIVPTDVLTGLGDSALLGPLVLMLVAFVLSLCSEADAFVAASFSQFTPGAQLAFLSFGPVFDMKLGLLYGVTFGRVFAVALALLAVPVVLVASVLMQELVF